jgi:cytochrome c oxidase cbb3-type subunit 4
MDIILARSLFTVLSLCVFVALVAWVYKRGNKAQFEEAARQPLAED